MSAIDHPQFAMKFPSNTANPVFFRTYSRLKPDGLRESWEETTDRTTTGLIKLGNLDNEEAQLIRSQQLQLHAMVSGRLLWVGGTWWSEQPENYSGTYNCSGFRIYSFERMAFMMGLLMQGCGVGTLLEPECIDQLPAIACKIKLKIIGTPGDLESIEHTTEKLSVEDGDLIVITITVGDSRQGWIDAYRSILELAAHTETPICKIVLQLGHIRAAGQKINGFGGVTNPVGLPKMFQQMVKILNKAVGRKLTSVEVCLLLDEAAIAVVSGNVRRSANIRQFSSDDLIAAVAKDNLWLQRKNKSWYIDPDRDALRMGNHTRVFHHKPSLQECIDAVSKQYHSGEGAIQWAGEAVARSNADLLNTPERKQGFLDEYAISIDAAADYLEDCSSGLLPVDELKHRMGRYLMNPCGEIISNNFMCNLSEVHLNLLNPHNLKEQRSAFQAASLSVAVLLNHKFIDAEQQYSRELDPIVGVSFTGLFDFFIDAFGIDWLKWWSERRGLDFAISEAGWTKCCEIAKLFKIEICKPCSEKNNDRFYHEGEIYRALEAAYLNYWRIIVEETIDYYCEKHNLKTPNRCTTVQPSGTKSLLTGASPGFHPPKAVQYIRRITFRKDDPVALACIDYGYTVIPSQSDKDENDDLLNDAYDPRCTEWLVEIPVAVSWANLPGVESINISQFSALAQMDFYMGVQVNYTRHNTSATIELREHEIEPLATRIYDAIQNDEGYISAALLARFDDHQTFPRLPFEPISLDEHGKLAAAVLTRRKSDNFAELLAQYDRGDTAESGPAPCDSDKCLMPERKP
jgi:ribonucleotide reductase, class II